MCGRSRAALPPREHLRPDESYDGVQKSHAREHQDHIAREKPLKGGALLAAFASKKRDGVLAEDATNPKGIVTDSVEGVSPSLLSPSSTVSGALPLDSYYSKISTSSLYSGHSSSSWETCSVPNGPRQPTLPGSSQRSSSGKQCSRERPRSAHASSAGAAARCVRPDSGGSCRSARSRHSSLGVERTRDKMQASPPSRKVGEDSSALVASRPPKPPLFYSQDDIEVEEFATDASMSPQAKHASTSLEAAASASGSSRGPVALGSSGAANREKLRNMEVALRSKAVGKKKMMAQFLQKNNLDVEHTLFVLNGQDDHIRKALLRRDLCVENRVPGSDMWNLKWCVSDCDNDYKNLQEGDLYNHFQNNRELTTKAGLAQNLQRLAASELLDVDRFFPRSYDMSLPSEREDFILDFRRCAALNVAHQHRRLCSKRDRLFGASGYMCNATVLTTAANALQRWVDDLNGSHFYEANEHLQLAIDDEAWDALVLYSDVTEAQLCQLEAGTKRRDRNRGFTVSGGVLSAESDSSNMRQAIQPPTNVQAWPEFLIHQWMARAPEALQARLDSCIDALEEQWSQIYTHGPMNVWIVKPGTNSKASGVMCMSSLPEVLHHCKSCGNRIVQKYIERPLLLFGGRKFDIRQWVLVRSFAPLEVYMFSECYLRLCNDAFDLGDLANRQRHISNWSVNKHGKNIQEGAVASLSEFCAALKDITGEKDYWQVALQPKLKDIILHSLKAVQGCVTQRSECFELYGFDFMIGENLQPWLLEVNLSPACEARTPWISALLERMSSRLLELVLDGKAEPDGVEPDWNCISEYNGLAADSGASSIGDSALGVAGSSSVDAACMREDLTVVGHGFKLRNLKRIDDGLQKYFAGKLIQRVARGFLVRHRIRQSHRNHNAICIQRATRKWLFRQTLFRRHLNRSARLVQGVARQFLAVSSFLNIVRNVQAIVIQSQWRGHIGRRIAWSLRRKRAAELIQYHWLRCRERAAISKLTRWWRRTYPRIMLKRTSAALGLQSYWRGKISRRFVFSLRRHVASPTRQLSLVYALARWRRQNLAYSAHLSARRLQVFWRRFSFLRAVNLRILKRNVLRAWKFQSAETLAVVSYLQQSWRSRRLRLAFARVRVTCNILQRAWRAHRARKCQAARIAAAVRLQAATRCFFAYRNWVHSRRCSIRLQAAWRGAWRRELARRSVRNHRALLRATLTLQCAIRRTLAHREAIRRRAFLERSRRWLKECEADPKSLQDSPESTRSTNDSTPQESLQYRNEEQESLHLDEESEESVHVPSGWTSPLLEKAIDETRLILEEAPASVPPSPHSGRLLDDVEFTIEDTESLTSASQDLVGDALLDTRPDGHSESIDREDALVPMTEPTPLMQEKLLVTERSTSSCVSSQASFANQSTASDAHDSFNGNDDQSSCGGEEESRDEIHVEVEPLVSQNVAQKATPLVAVRSESGTDLHVRPAVFSAAYPPMQLLSAPRTGWEAEPRDKGFQEPFVELHAKESDIAAWAQKVPPSASVSEMDKHFEAKLLGFVSQAEKNCKHGAADAHPSRSHHRSMPRRSTEDCLERRSGGSALHAARGLRDASSSSIIEQRASSRARSASARRSRGQQQAMTVLHRYGNVASMCEAGQAQCNKQRSHLRYNRATNHENVRAQGSEDVEKKLQKRRSTVEEILEIASTTRTIKNEKHCSPPAKLGAAIAASINQVPRCKTGRRLRAADKLEVFSLKGGGMVTVPLNGAVASIPPT